jgi:uncharacterized membrane protein HdeD (DUF308 family)
MEKFLAYSGFVMGPIIIVLGLYLLLTKSIQTDIPLFAFGGFCVLYGAFRLYRSIKLSKNKEEQP